MTKAGETEITLARDADCVALANLSRVAIEHGLRWRWKPSKLLRVIHDQESSVIVARRQQDHSLMGFAVMEFKQTHAHLSLLATELRFRRQGVASKLLAWLAQSASVAGLDYISLEVREQNQSAIHFYERLGFQIERSISGYYDGRENAYRMRHDLIAPEIAARRP